MTSVDAYAMMVILEEFNLTSSATLFVYNEDKSYIAGPYTNQYNNEAQILPIRLIPGDNLTVELIYHISDTEIPNFVITSVSHDYRDILGIVAEDKFEDDNDLLECHNDINCPEGNDWQVEKRSVARIVFDGSYQCTETLINMTKPTGTPLFLTANHCYDNTQQVNSSIFYFNHESETCNKGDEGEEKHIIEGAMPRANHPDTDFQLIELNARLPSSYRPFFAGWVRDSIPRNSTVIHQPLGYRKKISSDADNAATNINPIVITDPFTGNVVINVPTGNAFTVGLDNDTTEGRSWWYVLYQGHG